MREGNLSVFWKEIVSELPLEGEARTRRKEKPGRKKRKQSQTKSLDEKN
jgi:hypothetical protein